MIIDVSDYGKTLKRVRETEIRRINIKEVQKIIPNLPWNKFRDYNGRVTIKGQESYKHLIDLMANSDLRNDSDCKAFEEIINTDWDLKLEANSIVSQITLNGESFNLLNGLISFYNNKFPFELVEDADFHDVFFEGVLRRLNIPLDLFRILDGSKLVTLRNGELVDVTTDKETIYGELETLVFTEELETTNMIINETLVGNAFYVADELTETYKIIIGFEELIEFLFEIYKSEELVKYRLARYIGVDCINELKDLGYTQKSIFPIKEKDYKIHSQLPNGTFVLMDIETKEMLILTDLNALEFKSDYIHRELNSQKERLDMAFTNIKDLQLGLTRLKSNIDGLSKVLYRLTQTVSSSRNAAEQQFNSISRMALCHKRDEDKMWRLYNEAMSNPVLETLFISL